MGVFLSTGLVNEVNVGCDIMAIEEVKILLPKQAIHISLYEGKMKESSWVGGKLLPLRPK